MSGSPYQLAAVGGSSPSQVTQFWMNYAKSIDCSPSKRVDDDDEEETNLDAPSRLLVLSNETIDCMIMKITNNRNLMPSMATIKQLSPVDSLFVNVPLVEDANFPLKVVESTQMNKSILYGFTDDEGGWLAAMEDPKRFSPLTAPSLTSLDKAKLILRKMLRKMDFGERGMNGSFESL